MGIFSGMLDLLFPPRCVFCRSFLKNGEGEICSGCKRDLPFCEGQKALQRGEFFSACISPLYYEGNVKKSLHRFKFKDATGYRSCYSKILAHCITENFEGKYDIISWVPVSDERRKRRGYDQAMLLALETALELSDVAVETLKKVRDVVAQSTLGGKAERRANISGAYIVTDPELIQGKRILLIDDIITTGSTLSECARTLLLGEAEEVMCAALARSRE